MSTNIRGQLARFRCRQRGSVLIIGMLLLLMMTLLALLSTSETRTDARITANALDRAIAFQIAEAALVYVEDLFEGEKELPDGTDLEDADCFFSDYLTNDAGVLITDENGNWIPEEPSRDYSSWDASNTCEYTESAGADALDVVKPPVFVIDQLVPADATEGYVVTGEVYHERKGSLFRITVIAYGRSASTYAVLQTVFNPGLDN